jgi:malic enzyme
MGRKRAAVKKSSVSSNPPQLFPIIGNAALDSTGTESADRVHVEAESFVASASSPANVDGDHVPVPLPRKSKTSVSRAECWNHMDKQEIVENGIEFYCYMSLL